jgi:hypothetical protein
MPLDEDADLVTRREKLAQSGERTFCLRSTKVELVRVLVEVDVIELFAESVRQHRNRAGRIQFGLIGYMIFGVYGTSAVQWRSGLEWTVILSVDNSIPVGVGCKWVGSGSGNLFVVSEKVTVSIAGSGGRSEIANLPEVGK